MTMPRIAALNPETASAASKLTPAVFTKGIGFIINMMTASVDSQIPLSSWATMLGALSKALPALGVPHFA